MQSCRLRQLKQFVLCSLMLAGLCAPAWARFNPVSCKNAFTPEQEISEGQKIAAQVYQQMPVLPESDPVSQYVQRLGARLTAHAPGQRWPFSFHVVAVQDINAFALPGGSIFVNLGTVQAAETEAQLAGVLAHESSHVVLRHSTCNITGQQNKKVLYGLGSILSSIVLGNGAAGSLAQAGLGIGENLQFLRMSRDDEKQADLLGADILYDSGYDPRGMPQFFETIRAKYGAGGAQLLTDHPNPGNRMEYVNAEIATLPARTGSTVTTADFTRVHALAMGEQVYTAQDVQSGAWKRSGRYASGPGGGVLPVGQGQSSAQQRYPGQSNGGQNNPGQGNVGDAGTSSAGRLSRSALGIGSRLVRFQGDRYSLNYPANWQHNEDANGTVTLTPAGGVGARGVTYGAVIDVEQQPGDGVNDLASLAAATRNLAQKLSQQNGGLQQAGQLTSTTINGQAVNILELRGRSGIEENGAPLTESDRLVTFARSDGDISYIVFVAPLGDVGLTAQVFNAMAGSFRSQ